MTEAYLNELTAHAKLIEFLSTWQKIQLPDVLYVEKLCWCLENCQDKFSELPTDPSRIWYFQNDQDAAMFTLKWS
jgi:hypothetical protein